MLNPIRLTKENSDAVESLVRDAKNDLLTAPRAVNAIVKNNIGKFRKLFVKPAKGK